MDRQSNSTTLPVVSIGGSEIKPLGYKGIRIITTELLAREFGATEKNLHDNFGNNSTRFEEGVHFFRVSGNELRSLKNHPDFIGVVAPKASHLILWSERGVFRHAKILETDEAWRAYERLEDVYFAVREVITGSDVGLDPATREMIRTSEGILKQMNRKVTNLALAYGAKHDAMQAKIESLEDELHRINTGLKRAGVTSLQVWVKYGLPTGIRGATQWLTSRLLAMGAGIPFNGKADIHGRPIHLFDPDKVDYFMKETGLLLRARTYATERQGQRKFKL